MCIVLPLYSQKLDAGRGNAPIYHGKEGKPVQLTKLLDMRLIWRWIVIFLGTTPTAHLATSTSISTARTQGLHRRSRGRVGMIRLWPGCRAPMLVVLVR